MRELEIDVHVPCREQLREKDAEIYRLKCDNTQWRIYNEEASAKVEELLAEIKELRGEE